MAKGYTVDGILDEIKRKKEREAAEAQPQYRPQPQYQQPPQYARQEQEASPPARQPYAGQGDFFEQRRSGAPQSPPVERVPTYSPERHGADPMTENSRNSLYNTLNEYFGKDSQTWVNQGAKRQRPAQQPAQQPVSRPASPARQPAQQPAARPASPARQPAQQPAARQPAPTQAAAPAETPKQERQGGFRVTIPAEDAAMARPEEGYSMSAVAEKAPLPPKPRTEPPRQARRSDEQKRGFNVTQPIEEAVAEEPLTASTNPQLYKDFVNRRQNKVEEFMHQVREPTEGGLQIPEEARRPRQQAAQEQAPAGPVQSAPIKPTKVKFAKEKSNSEVAAGLVAGNAYEQDEPDDYMEPSQATAVQKDLSGVRFGLIMRLALTGALFLASLALALSPVLGYALPSPFDYNTENIVFPITQLALVCVAALICNVTVGGGIISLFKLHATNDSYAAAAVLGAVVLGVSFVLAPDKMAAGGENLYFPLAILSLVFNTVGKLLMMSRISANFDELIKPGEKSALLPVHNRELARELTGQTDEVPRFCCSAKAGFFTGFLDLSYREDATDGISKIVAPIAVIGSIVAAGISFFFTGSIHTSVVGLSAALIVAAPLSATIAGNFPVLRACKRLNRDGTVMAGGYTAETFAEADSILLDIDDIFPDGSITLHGIKTFAQGRIDEAILDAASVICSTRSTLGSIFINVVQGDRSLLRPADTIVYEDGMGLSAWVNSKRVLIGNRELMMNHGVEIPSRDYEEKYVGGGRDILYLSNSGELTAMFVLSYHADEEVKRSLDIFARRGVKLVINCTDPNITVDKLAALFDFPVEHLKILSSKYQPQCSELTREREKAPAAAVYNGKLSQLSDILGASGSVRQACFLNMLLEIVGVVLGFIMVVFFLFTDSMGSLGLVPLLLYQLFWAAAVMVVTLLRKAV